MSCFSIFKTIFSCSIGGQKRNCFVVCNFELLLCISMSPPCFPFLCSVSFCVLGTGLGGRLSGRCSRFSKLEHLHSLIKCWVRPWFNFRDAATHCLPNQCSLATQDIFGPVDGVGTLLTQRVFLKIAVCVYERSNAILIFVIVFMCPRSSAYPICTSCTPRDFLPMSKLPEGISRATAVSLSNVGPDRLVISARHSSG